MKVPRIIAKLISHILGYSWLPCPRCGLMVGGFERTDEVIWDDEKKQIGSTCCKYCP